VRYDLFPEAVVRTESSLSEKASMHLTIRILLIVVLLLSVGFWGWKQHSRRPVGIYVGAPADTSDPGCTHYRSLVLNISPRHLVKLNHDAVQFESLAATLKNIYRERYDRILFVRAEPDVSFQEAMTVLDLARGAVPDMHLILLTPGLEKTEPCLLMHLPEKMGMSINAPIATPS
jgi:biopolymer transport protein ExbD